MADKGSGYPTHRGRGALSRAGMKVAGSLGEAEARAEQGLKGLAISETED